MSFGRGAALPLAVSCAIAPLAVCHTMHTLLGKVYQPLLYTVLRYAKQAHYTAAAVIVIGAGNNIINCCSVTHQIKVVLKLIGDGDIIALPLLCEQAQKFNRYSIFIITMNMSIFYMRPLS